MENPHQFKMVLDILPFACVLITDDFLINHMNPIMSEFLCLTEEEKVTMSTILNYIPNDERDAFMAYITEFKSASKGSMWKMFRFIDSEGRYKPIMVNGTNNLEKLDIPGAYFLVGVPLFDDNIAKNQAIHTGKNLFDYTSNKRYENIFENAPIGIAILHSQGFIEEINKVFKMHLGVSKEDILSKHYSKVFEKQSERKINQLFQFITTSNRKLVKDVITLISLDREHLIIKISLSPIRTGEEKIIKYMMITEDITDQQDTHAALLQSEKLALTGRLAASLAHEINNPLQTSIGCLGLVEEMLHGDEGELGVYINMAMEELQRGARIVKRLRDLNRKVDSTEKTHVNIQELIEDVLLLTKNRLYDNNIVPILPYQGPAPYAFASKDQIQQVVLNLMMNAIDAIPNGGNIYLDINHTSKPAGVIIKIRDTGEGIKPVVMKNLFDPFFTTKDDGLGLGLYICKQIVEDHEGSLNVSSEPGKGTEFSVWLPGLGISIEQE